jgi:hypothetical protein
VSEAVIDQVGVVGSSSWVAGGGGLPGQPTTMPIHCCCYGSCCHALLKR